MTQDDFITRLRGQTQDLHARAYTQPFFEALSAGELPLEAYVSLLRCHAVMRGALERQVSGAVLDSPVFAPGSPGAALVAALPRRLPQVLADLEVFTTPRVRDVVPALRVALRAADQIMTAAFSHPHRLLGHLYLFEGSMNGGRVLAPQFARAFNLEQGRGLSFLQGGLGMDAQAWPEFLRLLTEAAPDLASQAQVMAGARDSFEAMIELYGALHPVRPEDLGYHASALNPEAGDHAVPTDPGEIEAALAAARDCWQAFGYYEQRYGARGRRFAASDVAWLVAMAQLEQPVLDRQVLWLANLLVGAGMPRLLLETQLRLLHKRLVGEYPGKADLFGRLWAAADALKAIRCLKLDEEEAQALAQAIDRSLEAEVAPRWRRLGDLVVAAAVDEGYGLVGKAGPLTEWLAQQPDLQGPTLALLAATTERIRSLVG